MDVDEISEPNLIVDLTDVAKEIVFSHLSVRDLKNLRICSPRLSRDVFRLDSRFKSLTLTDSDNLPRVLYSKDITARLCTRSFMGKSVKLYNWMRRHSSSITTLKLNLGDGFHWIASPHLKFPRLKKVELSIGGFNDAFLKKLLLKFGPKMERLQVCRCENLESAARYSEKYDLCRLKHASFHVRLKSAAYHNGPEFDVGELFKLLGAATGSLQELYIASSCVGELQMPVIGKRFVNLRRMDINMMRGGGTIVHPIDFFERCAGSLTHLSLRHVDFTVLQMMRTKHTALQEVNISHCELRTSQFKSLLCASAPTLKAIRFEKVDTEVDCDVDFTLPFLHDMTAIGSVQSWLLKGLKSLTALNLHRTSVSVLNEFEGNIPTLKLLRVSMCHGTLDLFLNSCPNLTTLILDQTVVSEDTRAPNLKHLIIDNKRVNLEDEDMDEDEEPDEEECCLGGLLNSCRSSLECLGLDCTCSDLSILEDVDGCLTNLKKFCIHPPPSEENFVHLQDFLLPASVEVYHWKMHCFESAVEKLVKTGEWPHAH